MSEMVEKVARSIAEAFGDDYDAVPKHKPDWVAKRGEFGGRFRDVNEPYQADYDDMARAAIAAMREPSKEMVQAATTDQGLLAQAFWDAMIRTAIAAETPTEEPTA